MDGLHVVVANAGHLSERGIRDDVVGPADPIGIQGTIRITLRRRSCCCCSSSDKARTRSSIHVATTCSPSRPEGHKSLAQIDYEEAHQSFSRRTLIDEQRRLRSGS